MGLHPGREGAELVALELIVVGCMLVGWCLAVRQAMLTYKVATSSGTTLPQEAASPVKLAGQSDLVSPADYRATASAGVDPGQARASLGPLTVRPDASADIDWPSVAILIPAHNEERVIAGCLAAMTSLDYPEDRLTILVVDDRSSDRTGEIAKSFVMRDPKVRLLQRHTGAKPGKSAAIVEAMAQVDAEIVVLFDADYLPRPALLKELVAPFRDPSVGATMGRVVPFNSDSNLLTRLLDLERRAGYAVDQQGRALLRLAPQFGGTVGGLRVSALEAVGGWKEGHLAEDTDLTFRLMLGGWKVRYLNEASCYEEVPEDWTTRYRQVRRWSYGHNDCMLSYLPAIFGSRKLALRQKADAAMILLFYFFPALALLSMFMSVIVLAYAPPDGIFCAFCYLIGPVLAPFVLAPIVQIAVAATKDDQSHVVVNAPLLMISSAISLLAATAGLAMLCWNRLSGGAMRWDKTSRYRPAS